MANRIVWFDIPVSDLDRAIRFYSAVLDIEITEEHPGVAVMAHGANEISGCLYKTDEDQITDSGLLLYFNVNGRLGEAVDGATENGGSIVEPKHEISQFGFRAKVIDSEGNTIALHSE
jgi:hypothetical protein